MKNIRCSICFSRKISIQLSFCKCNTDRFSQKKRKVRNETSWALMIYPPFYFNACQKGPGTHLGYRFVHLLIDPLGCCQHTHNGWSTKHKRLFWCNGKAAKEKMKTFSRKHQGEWEEKAIWLPNSFCEFESFRNLGSTPSCGYCTMQNLVKLTQING